MNFRVVLFALGSLLVLMGLTMGTSLIPSIWLGDGAWVGLTAASATTVVVGLGLRRFRTDGELGLREGFAVAAFGWFVAGIFGSLPYLFTGEIPNLVDAYFESVSGLTTTGATILTEIEGVAKGVLFWRSLSQWVGGMGIIVLAVAILPMLGVGGMQLFRAEVPGPVKDRLLPRIQDTAKLLWGVYVGFTASAILAYHFAGMSVFDATCHAFTALSTGGFSTKNASIAAYGSAVHWITIGFMFLAGINYSLHFLAIRGRPLRYFQSEEFIFYLGAVVLLSGFLFGLTWSLAPDWLTGFRDAAFQATSILTGTGFGTADYELWPIVAQFTLLVVITFGACAGSTAGGFKCVRVLLVIKQAYVIIFRTVHPHASKHVKLDNHIVEDAVMNAIMGMLALILMVKVVSTTILVATGMDVVSGLSAVFTCLNNVGPGLGTVGPTDNFAHVAWGGKVLLTTLMIMGRLELFTVFVLFLPSFWRK